MTRTFKARLRANEAIVGPLISLPALDVSDLLSRTGFDYL